MGGALTPLTRAEPPCAHSLAQSSARPAGRERFPSQPPSAGAFLQPPGRCGPGSALQRGTRRHRASPSSGTGMLGGAGTPAARCPRRGPAVPAALPHAVSQRSPVPLPPPLTTALFTLPWPRSAARLQVTPVGSHSAPAVLFQAPPRPGRATSAAEIGRASPAGSPALPGRCRAALPGLR